MTNPQMDASIHEIFVTVSKGSMVRHLLKEQFEGYLCDFMEEIMDMDRISELREYYLNAYEWILLNLYRIAGLQLYEDGEIRINISPSKMMGNKKCIFLKESEIENRNFDRILYDELERLIIEGI